MPRDVDAADKTSAAPLPALFPDPLVARDAAEAVTQDAFLLRGGLVDAWFLRRSDVLLVTFDNLASVGEYDPPQPWLQMRAANAGVSILGIMASRKDWYRNDDTAPLIESLRDAGLFAQFRRVCFVGASMGGFAALTYSSLVPGSVVLAFSPQTSLSRKIARFDKRYRYAARTWDWDSPAHLDAATAASLAAEVYVVFDPFVPEDRAHADRIAGPRVRQIKAPHMGHRAIRQLKSVGVLQALIERVAKGTFDPLAHAKGYRARRGVVGWQKALFGEAIARGHIRLGLRAAEALLRQTPDSRMARKAVETLRAATPVPKVDTRARVGTEIKADTPVNTNTRVKGDKPVKADTRIKIGTPPGPFSGAILRLSQALVVPERNGDTKLASGVLLADGRWCKLSQAWIRVGKAMPAPTLSPDEPVQDLPGRHLFAGHFRRHFGHFLVESTARLWALDHVRDVDSILYLPYRGDTDRGIDTHDAFFDLMGIKAPRHVHPGVVRVEHLIVPELGFGWGDRYAGSPGYRAFIQGRLAHVARQGSDRLYISRAKLRAERGGVLGETLIETAVEQAGFEVFHPERHPVAVQIARYKAARQIVSLDGSALHLAAFVVRPETRVTMILRRSRANTADYRLQFQTFAGITPSCVDAVRTDWVSGDANRADFQSVGELDFAHLFAALRDLGHLPADLHPDLPDKTDITALLDAFATRRGRPFRPLATGERHPDQED